SSPQAPLVSSMKPGSGSWTPSAWVVGEGGVAPARRARWGVLQAPCLCWMKARMWARGKDWLHCPQVRRSRSSPGPGTRRGGGGGGGGGGGRGAWSSSASRRNQKGSFSGRILGLKLGAVEGSRDRGRDPPGAAAALKPEQEGAHLRRQQKKRLHFRRSGKQAGCFQSVSFACAF
ncbi:unnamed protein product, partial [Tetraodon nigroviridis]